MKLLRLAAVYFDTLDPSHEALTLNLDGVSVTPMPVGNAPPTPKRRILAVAVLSLKKLPIIGSDSLLDVPEAERKACERAIEAYANTISVASRTSRSISSPSPCVAFVAEDDAEKVYLQGASGIRGAGGLGGIPDMHSTIPITDEIVRGLADRLEGVSLLSEMNSQTSALGRYRECTRFIELAFAGTFTDTGKKVIQFLLGSVAGHTSDEVKAWFSHRHGSVHGDKKRTKKLVIETDVRHFMPRMELAVRDILLNKAKWHDRSSERRQLWKPSASTTSPDGLKMMVVQGTTGPGVTAQLLDQFSAYPFDLSAVMTTPPASWWCGRKAAGPDEQQRFSGSQVEVRALK